jgi:hypothetical protein
MTPLTLLLSASESKSEEVLLKYKATVIEETKDYVIIKFHKTDIGLFTERGKPTETLATQQNLGKISLAPSSSEPALSRAELKREILQELRGEIQKEATKGLGPIEYGSVDGRMIRRGVGEPEVRVKLVRWVEEASLLGVLKELKKGAEFETTTDQEGKYAFKEIPVGSYELKWLPHGSDAWIRRLTERPDITVRKATTVTVRTVELGRPVLP